MSDGEKRKVGRPGLPGGSRRIDLRLPEATAQRLEERARDMGIPVGTLARQLLESELAEAPAQVVLVACSVYCWTNDRAAVGAGKRMPLGRYAPHQAEKVAECARALAEVESVELVKHYETIRPGE